MVSASQVAQLIGNVLAYLTTVLGRNLLVIIQYMFVNYPEVSRIILVLIGSYIVYKVVIKMIKMWVRTVILIVKLTMLFLLLLFMVALYIRGLKLISQDIPNLWHLVSNRDEYVKTSYEMFDRINVVMDYISKNDELKELFLATKKNMDGLMDNPESLDKAKEYVDKYVDKEFQETVKDFVQQGSAVAGQFVNYAQDNQNLRNFVNNLWN